MKRCWFSMGTWTDTKYNQDLCKLKSWCNTSKTTEKTHSPPNNTYFQVQHALIKLAKVYFVQKRSHQQEHCIALPAIMPLLSTITFSWKKVTVIYITSFEWIKHFCWEEIYMKRQMQVTCKYTKHSMLLGDQVS